MANQYTLKNGKTVAEYIDEAGFGLGFAIGNAVRLCFKSVITTDPDERQRLMKGYAWYIDHASKATHMNKEEIAEIVSRITGRIQSDQIGEI